MRVRRVRALHSGDTLAALNVGEMMTLLELLQAGDVDTFNATRGQRTRVELFAADLAEANLIGVDLSGADVAKADLTGADLTDSNLFRANLSGIDGTGMKLVSALAHRVSLREAYLDDADLSDADLSRGELGDAVLTRSQGDSLRLIGAKLRAVDAAGVQWPDSDLTEAQLHKANFEGANLQRAHMVGATGAEACFRGANLEAVVATGARFGDADLSGANLAGSNFTGASLNGANLSGADLTGANLSQANLTGATLTGATLAGLNLNAACLDGVNLEGLDLTGVDLTGVDASALGLSDAQLRSLAAHGADVDESAPLRVQNVALAAHNGVAVALWLNEPEGSKMSARWARFQPGSEPTMATLPISCEGVLSYAVVPSTSGFSLLVFQERPTGASLVRYPVDANGGIGPSQIFPLGYQPGVNPLLRAEDGFTYIWGVARKGPTLVVHRLDDEGYTLVHSETAATLRGLYGDTHPVAAAKGGVVLPVSPTGLGAPLRTPDGFTGPLHTAAPSGDGVVCVWNAPRKSSRDPGGLRHVRLSRRGQPEPEVLTTNDAVGSLSLTPLANAQTRVLWTELHPEEPAHLYHVTLPEGEITRVKLPLGLDAERVECARSVGDVQVVGIVTPDEGLAVVALDGTIYGTLD